MSSTIRDGARKNALVGVKALPSTLTVNADLSGVDLEYGASSRNRMTLSPVPEISELITVGGVFLAVAEATLDGSPVPTELIAETR